MANVGKIFETDFKNSVPDDCLCLRLPDSATGFGQDSSRVRFSMKSPFDFLLFKSPKLYCLELKSTGKKSLSFEREGEKTKRDVHLHQIKALQDCDAYENAVCGFIFNFRKCGTYFLSIAEFMKFYNSTSKKSISVDDVEKLDYYCFTSKKKKVHYAYDIEDFLQEYNE